MKEKINNEQMEN